MYEQYTHYVPVDAERLSEIAIALATSYANLCDRIFAPSASVRDILIRRGVTTPIDETPTGVDVEQYARGDGRAFRKEHRIPNHALVVGHVGRLAPEKNLEFLSAAVRLYLHQNPLAVFLLVGSGPSVEQLQLDFQQDELANRLVYAGKQTGTALVDAYHAMDLFAFSSLSETQGVVLVEAMAAGKPVVALDASGAREVVVDGINGRLVSSQSPHAFATAIDELVDQLEASPGTLETAARATAEKFSTTNCARRALGYYNDVVRAYNRNTIYDQSAWGTLRRSVQEEWTLWSDRMAMARCLLFNEPIELAATDEQAQS